MRRVHWWSALVLIGGLACSASDDTTMGIAPIQRGPGAGGAPAGGTSGGTGGGSTTGGGSRAPLGGLTGGGGLIGIGGPTGGGSAAGGLASAGGIGMSTVMQAGPCEQQVAQAGPTVPDIMIVLDRSSSMAPAIDPRLNCQGLDPLTECLLGLPGCACGGIDCTAPPYMGTVNCGGTMPSPAVDRWTPAVQGVKTLTMQFQDKISFGLTVFPGDGAGNGGPGGGDLCAPGTQRVATGLKTAGMIAQSLNNTQPSGATPTAAALQAVHQQIMQKMSDPDAKVPPQYVMLVTDGQPTCPNSRGNVANPAALQQDNALTIQALDALTKAGVKTYVLGYDATVDPALAMALTQFAMHGGTGDFHPVKDAASIVEQFTKITASVASCSYTLDKKPHDPTYVLVKLDKQQLDLDKPDGWTIDGQNVTIQGASCTKLKDGATHQLVVTVECDPVPPLQ
jgi:von Willebrand factor type A domain